MPSLCRRISGYGQRLGVTTLSASRMGPTTVLGTQEISLLQLTGAYATFANAGKRAVPRAILRVEDSAGHVLYSAPAVPQAAQVISPQAAYMLTSVLIDNKARAPDFGYANNPLHFDVSRGEDPNIQIAAKTGTSSGPNGPPDIVTAGYSPFITAGVWIGNDDNSSMAPNIIGVAGAGYVFHDIMTWAYQNYHWPQVAAFPVPSGIAVGNFNCETGLAPYKGSTPADLDCQFRPVTGLGPGTFAVDLYNYGNGTNHRVNTDWYYTNAPPSIS